LGFAKKFGHFVVRLFESFVLESKSRSLLNRAFHPLHLQVIAGGEHQLSNRSAYGSCRPMLFKPLSLTRIHQNPRWFQQSGSMHSLVVPRDGVFIFHTTFSFFIFVAFVIQKLTPPSKLEDSIGVLIAE
jgi:hypothetical protein